jgi:hypothetical protein
MPDIATAPDRPFVCPRCQTLTSLANIRCPNCGVNLGLAVARAAKEILENNAGDVSLPYEADRFLPRFGEFLLRQGDITATQLEAALARQQSGSGQYRTVGQILLEMGAVNREQLDRASMAQIKEMQILLREDRAQLTQQGKRIQQLEAALADMAELNLSSIDFVESLGQRLQSLKATLKQMDNDTGSIHAAQTVDELISQVDLFVKKEK